MVFDQPRVGRHRSTGRHRSSGRARTTRPPATYALIRPRRSALPAGLATLLTILAGATAVSGWFAASGASAVMSMIGH
jgi:uncharacterized membrane protein